MLLSSWLLLLWLCAVCVAQPVGSTFVLLSFVSLFCDHFALVLFLRSDVAIICCCRDTTHSSRTRKRIQIISFSAHSLQPHLHRCSHQRRTAHLLLTLVVGSTLRHLCPTHALAKLAHIVSSPTSTVSNAGCQCVFDSVGRSTYESCLECQEALFVHNQCGWQRDRLRSSKLVACDGCWLGAVMLDYPTHSHTTAARLTISVDSILCHTTGLTACAV